MTAAQYATDILNDMINDIQEYLDNDTQQTDSPLEVEGPIS